METFLEQIIKLQLKTQTAEETFSSSSLDLIPFFGCNAHVDSDVEEEEADDDINDADELVSCVSPWSKISETSTC